jgi:hypothetical protein
MAGLISTIDWPGAAGVAAQGTEAIPSTTGQVLGAAATEGLEHAFPSATAQRQTQEMGLPLVDPESGQPLNPSQATASDPVLDPAELNRRFGIDKRLNFDRALPQSVAEEMQARTRETIAREDITNRREGGALTGTVARFGAGLIGGLPGLADPLNLAVSFMPVVSEARAALWAARFGDTGARALTGALAGAGGQAALTPLQYLQSRQDREDYSAVDAVLGIALGGVFGGGLHLLGGRFGAAEGRLAPELEHAAPETREALLRAGIADLAEDRPVESPAETYDYIRETGGAKPYETVPREPLRLAEFLRQQGGVQNEGGELGQMLDRVQNRPGLINKDGLSLDAAAERAWEDGYLPGLDRPDINTLLDHLESDLKGHPVYSAKDEAAAGAFHDALDRNAEIDRLSQEHGIPISGLTREQFFDQVAQKLGADRAHAEAEAAALWVGEHEDDLPPLPGEVLNETHHLTPRQLIDRAERSLKTDIFGDPIREPGSIDVEFEDLENAYRQEADARGPLESAPGAERPGAGTEPARADETGVGQGGGGVGARRRGEPPRAEPGGDLAPSRPAAQELADEIAGLDRELAAAGIEESAELTAANEQAAELEAIARATEQGAMCLGRRA